MFESFVSFVQQIYGSTDFIPLHEPRFVGNEKKYLLDTIDSTFVSSVGVYVNEFEKKVVEFTGAKYAVATVNGTAALHVSLLLAGVERDDEVLTQSLTFIATCNAISYCGATPVFIDVSQKTLGMSPNSLEEFLGENAFLTDEGCCINKKTGKKIRACVPMHTFGHPVQIQEIKRICDKYNIALVEDAAESLGSYQNDIHTGCFGKLSALSFNGNKIITTGGGGMILTNDAALAKKAKYITTTSKQNHAWEFVHDEIGFNYRLPNLNAALGCAQLEMLPQFILKKRQIASMYKEWAERNGIEIVIEPENAKSNYWLNALLLEDKDQLNAFLEFSNAKQVMTRPVWRPMHKLPMFEHCLRGPLTHTEMFAERLVNIPSGVGNL